MGNKQTFIDTSAFYAIIDQSDSTHEEAAEAWAFLLHDDNHLITSNYIILETIALLQNRISCKAAMLFQNDILSVVDTHWISQSIHQLSIELWKNQGLRHLSLVDCTSFIIMGRKHCSEAFTLDHHFAEQGFSLLP